MNQEREAKKNSVVYVDLTTALSPGEHSLKNVGYGILKYFIRSFSLTFSGVPGPGIYLSPII